MTGASTSLASIDRRAIPPGAREGWWTAPDGQAIRRLDWPQTGATARGSILFLPGRGDFYEKYLEALAHWHGRGWAIGAADWRGQGFSRAPDDRGVSDPVMDYAVWVADLQGLWQAWSAQTPGPHVIAGHSMGGHIVLRALAEHAISPDAAVLTAPMIGLQPEFMPRPVLHRFARIMKKVRGRRRSAWKGGERPDVSSARRPHLLTHDAERYADEAWWRRERPALTFSAPNWGWIEGSFASMAVIERAGALEAVKTPTLILATKGDKLVSFTAIRKAAARLAAARLITFGEEARHEILREADPVRTRALAEIDAFLDDAVTPPPASA